MSEPAAQQRRARPLLGTLVEISLPEGAAAADFEAGFAAISTLESALSRFRPDSELARLLAAPAPAELAVSATSARVLRAAQALARASGGLFDISLGTAPKGWVIEGQRFLKQAPDLRLDLGGIAKGHAVDLAIRALRRRGLRWAIVNAGGDLRVYGPRQVSLQLRDERHGGVRLLGELADGAFATSYYGPDSRSRLHGGPGDSIRHVSVAAPRCLWADALCKIVALSGDLQHPLLQRLDAQAWLHEEIPA